VALSAGLRSLSPARSLPLIALLGAAATGAGYFVVASVELSTYGPPSSLGQVARLALVCGVLFSNFLAAGLMIALIFTARPEAISRLYFADLAGAGSGCAAAIPMMLLLTPPGCVLASGAALALSGLRLAASEIRPLLLAGAPLAALLAAGSLWAHALPDPVVDSAKTMGAREFERWGFSRVFRRWSPVFRVDVLESPQVPGAMVLTHDGTWGSTLWEFDGSEAKLAQMFAASSREFPFAVAREDPRVLIIGAAGGNEILAALHFGAERITAVELNPVTVSLHTDHFPDYTGHLAGHEKVHMVNAEGRSFMRRDPSSYDVVYFVAPDSYASMNAAQASGFVLVESYLYTQEMVHEAVRHLRPGGILCMQFGEVNYNRKPNRTARYLATARRAFAELGIEDFERHVLLATTVTFPFQLSTILLQTTPFSERQIEAFLAVARKVPATRARHVSGRVRESSVTNGVITLPAERLDALYDGYAYEIRPVSDDAPFFWHFARFRDVIAPDSEALRDPIDPEDGRGESALLVMLALATAFAAVFLLLPFVAIRERWTRLPRKAPAALYFAALGLGFMFFEICLIQKLTLFLGYPTYTLTVTLFALLIFSGLGSYATDWYVEARDRMLPMLVGALLLLTLFYQFGLDVLMNALVGWGLAARIATTVWVLAPLGLCLGAFMPLGLGTVARLSELRGRLSELRGEYIAWCWAINGVFSVIASILATIVSMSYGFRMLLLLALGLYVLAGLALRAIPLEARGRV
jgi:spermidine synthase